MHSLPYLTVLCGATTAAAGLSLHSDLTDAVADVVDVVDDLADSAGDLIDAAKVIISKIPLSEFGQFEAVSLEEAVADPSLLDMLMKPDDGGSSTTDDATADDGLAVRATFANSSCNAASVSTRIEWSNYSDSDRLAFVDSIACLIETPSAGSHFSPSTNRYEDFVRTHQVLTSQIHHSGQFLLWHRYFVHALEQALRDECGFDRAMPWWDETLDSGAFHQSSLFTADYFGSLPGPVNGNGVCVTDGRFANMTCNIGPGSSNIPHCVSRAVNESLTAQANTDFVEYCEERTDFGSFSNCAEGGPHAWAHNGIGSVMSEVSGSPCDPIFYMHHLFVDYQISRWQGTNTTRKETVPGACEGASSPCTTMTVDTVLYLNELLPNVTVGDVLDTQGGLLCYTYDYF